MKRKNQKGLGLIYTRYIFPIVADLVLILLAFIPCIRFKLDTDARQTISLSNLISNAWSASRVYLFSSQTEQTPDGELFYRLVFIALIVCVIMFIIGIATHVFGMIAFFSSNKNDNSSAKLKNLYLTFIPNRVVAIVLRLLVLPLAFFPEILTKLYRSILFYSVSVGYSLIPIWTVAILLFVITLILTLTSMPYERRLSLNLFAKAKPISIVDDNVKDFEQDIPPQTKHYNMKQTSSEEEAEKLRKLLGYSNKDDYK